MMKGPEQEEKPHNTKDKNLPGLNKKAFDKILLRAAQVLKLEAKSIDKLSLSLGESFVNTYQLISQTKGRLVFSGMGKAGIIAQKISATFSSLGKPSFFLHPAEAAHGDLGMVTKDDLILIFSKSGSSEEVVSLIPSLKKIQIKAIAITANMDSKLAKFCHEVLLLPEKEEACNMGLAPTTSTTQMLALGDALAMVFVDGQDFDETHFAKFHPGGRLGQDLMPVEHAMRGLEEIVIVDKVVNLGGVLEAMTDKRIGSAIVVDSQKKMIGIFSDGDLRRFFKRKDASLNENIGNIMKENPSFIEIGSTVGDAREILIKKKIGELPVLDKQGGIMGAISLKDIV